MALAVDVTNFITVSNASKEAFKTATLLKTLNVSSLITGEHGVGKKSLAQYILPNASVLDANDYDELLTTLESVNEIVITNLENTPNIKTLFDIINSRNIRVIATSKSSYSNEYTDKLFGIKFDIPPLAQRSEDIAPLIDKFTNEASKLFGTNSDHNDATFTPDLSENSNSLKRQVMINYLLKDINDKELMDIIESHLMNKLGSNNDYKKFLHLYEVPIIKAGLKQFKSQLQLADRLGLNRNTLRKKISDNEIYL